ncbi:hypothetical protein [Saccharopolyspora rosea]|uniref:Uncharacterized protein n=1 Tax=Saccharopolyspora rosea TaxID=524884 RepID=A0ABW3G4I7_9PSEU|nr:hypothetical protein [Saccharopolyspora rosea]
MSAVNTDRIATLTRVLELLPELSTDEALRVAEWAETGSSPLDPARLDAAARELASGLGEHFADRAVANRMRGLAGQVITAYLARDGRVGAAIQ